MLDVCMQEALVRVGDKKKGFAGSREWIGAFEVALAIDELFGAQCRIVHARAGSDAWDCAGQIHQHILTEGTPVMGECDAVRWQQGGWGGFR